MTPSPKTIPYGCCHCDCGQKTKIAKKTANDRGHVKGQPLRYIWGHGPRQKRVDLEDAAPFKIEGVYCRLLALTQNQFTIIDASDYGDARRLGYYAVWAENTKSYYAARTDPSNGRVVRLHRGIAGPKHDHANGVTLDNRRKNLRPASKEENGQNKRRPKNNTSGYKWVMRDQYNPRQWVAQIQADGKVHHVGTFRSAISAARAADATARRLHGEFARTNFP